MNFKTLNDYKKDGKFEEIQIKIKTKRKRPVLTREARAAEWLSSILMSTKSCKKLRRTPSNYDRIQKPIRVHQRGKRQKWKCC